MPWANRSWRVLADLFGRSCGNHLAKGRMAIDLEDPPMVANDFRLCLGIAISVLNVFQVLGGCE